MRMAQGFMCKLCKSGVRQVADECVGKFAYLGNMLNDTGGVEQAVAAKVRAAWMKFREFVGILCM